VSANEVHGVGLFCGRGGRVRVEMPPRGASGLWIARPDKNVAALPISLGMVAGPGADHSGWMKRADGKAIGVPPRNTTLVLSGAGAGVGAGAVVAATVEHVLSALAGMGVWDACVVLEGDEVPIDDGSALAFVELARHLKRGGLGGMGAADAEPIVLRERVEVRDASGAWIVGEPLDGIEYAYALDYGAGSPIPAQRAVWRGDAEAYAREIAPARTFSLRAEAEAARAAGLFAHLTPAEMVVVGDDGLPMANAWRTEDEPSKHKLLDLIGDLALLGRPLHAKVTAHRSGHAMTHEFCRRVSG
jgi:UDP-3-O-acyl-N-acetylglucosamine deacetylase